MPDSLGLLRDRPSNHTKATMEIILVNFTHECLSGNVIAPSSNLSQIVYKHLTENTRSTNPVLFRRQEYFFRLILSI